MTLLTPTAKSRPASQPLGTWRVHLQRQRSFAMLTCGGRSGWLQRVSWRMWVAANPLAVVGVARAPWRARFPVWAALVREKTEKAG